MSVSDPDQEIAEKAPHVLVVDDDDRIRSLLRRYLNQHGFRTSIAADGEEARKLLTGVTFDLLILDVMMPKLTGFELTERVRSVSNVPILLLTARGLPQDRIDGLERGADDYLTKPFEPRELLLRANALLRRTMEAPSNRDQLEFGKYVFWPARGELRRDGELVKLSTGEVALLRALAAKPREPITRTALAKQMSSTMERSVDVQVTRLRKKIEDDPRAPIYLQTVRGVGYTLIPD